MGRAVWRRALQEAQEEGRRRCRGRWGEEAALAGPAVCLHPILTSQRASGRAEEGEGAPGARGGAGRGSWAAFLPGFKKN